MAPKAPVMLNVEKEPIILSENKEYGSTNNNQDVSPRSLEEGRASVASRRLLKTHESFWEDARNLTEGTIPQSAVLAVVIGIVCGVSAFAYYFILEALLEYIWKTIPEQFIVGVWPEWAYVLWIPLVGFTLCIGLGLSVVFLGDPGDLPYTIKCVHEKGYIAMDHVVPMVAASQFSILGGGSLGPEAPLVAICAALGGFVSRTIFKQTVPNVIRKHTLMGMSASLAAFFGCPLGGSLFALEVNSRFGVEYFEHIVESILAGEICLAVFRALARLPIESIWTITTPKLTYASPLDILMGCGLGLVGAFVAFVFASMHRRVLALFQGLDLLRDDRAVYRALVGATVILTVGMILPHTLFWGEIEFQTIASLSPAATLPHVWPTSGLFGFEMESASTCLLVGAAKLVAISFTVAGGYRGGFIFPFFATGAALGRAITFLIPAIPAQLAVLCMAAAINVAITRTSIATTLILVYLAGEQNLISAVLASSLVSLFATGYMPFIKSQIERSDLDNSLYLHEDEMLPLEESPDEDEDGH